MLQKMTRREMLRLAALGGAGALLAACTPAATPTTAPAAAATATPAAAAPAATMAPTTAPAKGAAVKFTNVEAWFGVPQVKESIDPVIQAINSKLQADGVNIEIASLLLDDYDNKYPLLYSSGADFTSAFDAPWYKMTSLRDQNALLPLEDLITQYGKNLKTEITDKIYTTNFVNNHLYGIPAAYYYAGTGGVIFREDLRQKYNAALPTSKDGWPSLEPYLDAILKNESGTIPFANVATQSLTGYNRNRLSWAPGPVKTGVMIKDATKDWTFIDEEANDEEINTATLLRSWWEKGYVNKTDLTFSGTSQSAESDYLFPGKAAACVENEPNYKFVDLTKQLQASIKTGTLMGVDMTGEIAGNKGLGTYVEWNYIVVNANAPKLQQAAVIQYWDWLASNQDNADLWLMGIDGKNYKKETGLTFSEIAGTDASKNYRRQWYVSGLSGKLQRQPADLPQEAKDALAFFTTESNWAFNPYETFQPDTKALEVDSAKLSGVYDEAVHGLNTGQTLVADSTAKMKKMLDDAGRQTYKEKLQKQLSDFIAAHK